MIQRKPSETDACLKLIIEWMDETFNKNDEESLKFFELFHANMEPFRIFLHKKYNALLAKEGKRPPAKIYQFKKTGGDTHEKAEN